MSAAGARSSVLTPALLRTPEEMRAWTRRRRGAGEVALVPTMGALHAGHLGLFAEAARRAASVVVSIYVNPAQFDQDRDLEQYPGNLEADLAACASAGVDAVFAPGEAGLYRTDHSTWVTEERLALPLEGAARPGHFRGMLTVVLKLFNIVQPDLAVFGQKDAQQALLVRRMLRDLDLPVRLLLVPTAREADGLALSSRNVFLDRQQRCAAPGLWQALQACAGALAAGETDPERVRQAGLDHLGRTPGLIIEYLQVVDLDMLEVPRRATGPVLVAAAVRLGGTRLIDNLIYPAGAAMTLAAVE